MRIEIRTWFTDDSLTQKVLDSMWAIKKSVLWSSKKTAEAYKSKYPNLFNDAEIKDTYTDIHYIDIEEDKFYKFVWLLKLDNFLSMDITKYHNEWKDCDYTIFINFYWQTISDDTLSEITNVLYPKETNEEDDTDSLITNNG